MFTHEQIEISHDEQLLNVNTNINNTNILNILYLYNLFIVVCFMNTIDLILIWLMINKLFSIDLF